MQEEICSLKLIMVRKRQDESSEAQKQFQILLREEAAKGTRQLEVQRTNEKQELKTQVVKMQDKSDQVQKKMRAQADAEKKKMRAEADAEQNRLPGVYWHKHGSRLLIWTSSWQRSGVLGSSLRRN